MNGVREIVRFTGPVECRFDRTGPLGLTLVGRDDSGPVQVAFLCAAPGHWPSRLEDALVTRAEPGRIGVSAGTNVRMLDAPGVFVHRDVTRAFECAVPPRRAPLAKRLLWQCVLAFAATALGRRVLTH